MTVQVQSAIWPSISVSEKPNWWCNCLSHTTTPKCADAIRADAERLIVANLTRISLIRAAAESLILMRVPIDVPTKHQSDETCKPFEHVDLPTASSGMSKSRLIYLNDKS